MRTRLFGLGLLVMLAGAVLALGVLWAAPAALADGKAGDLDTSFGDGGRVTTDFSSGSDTANAVAIQSDGKIVAAATLR